MENKDQENYPSEQFEMSTDYTSMAPQRHGCVTAWLIIMLLLNSVVSLMYFFMAGGLAQKLNVSTSTIFVLGVIGVLNVVFSVLMLNWRKIGFYGFAALGIVTFAINISIGISVVSCVVGLCGFAILYAVFQIKKNGVSAWSYLK